MRIVIKVGSNVLTRKDGHLDITRMSAIIDQIAWLKQQQHEVILVSSGAVACGRRELKVDHDLDTVEQRQLFSALGQVKLIGLYYDLFREHNMHVGQILTMKENFQPGEQFDNQRACMKVMLENDVIPIFNENDTVNVKTTRAWVVKNEGALNEQLKKYCVIIAEFKQLLNARSIRDRFKEGGYPGAFIVQTPEPYYYVVAAAYTDLSDAVTLTDKLRRDTPVRMKAPCPYILMPSTL